MKPIEKELIFAGPIQPSVRIVSALTQNCRFSFVNMATHSIHCAPLLLHRAQMSNANTANSTFTIRDGSHWWRRFLCSRTFYKSNQFAIDKNEQLFKGIFSSHSGAKVKTHLNVFSSAAKSIFHLSEKKNFGQKMSEAQTDLWRE